SAYAVFQLGQGRPAVSAPARSEGWSVIVSFESGVGCISAAGGPTIPGEGGLGIDDPSRSKERGGSRAEGQLCVPRRYCWQRGRSSSWWAEPRERLRQLGRADSSGVG